MENMYVRYYCSSSYVWGILKLLASWKDIGCVVVIGGAGCVDSDQPIPSAVLVGASA